MYNRYIPNSSGNYERHTVTEKESSSCPVQPIDTPICTTDKESKPPKQNFPVKNHTIFGADCGDLLLLCIMLLLLVESEEDDLQSILILAAAFLFLQ